MAQVIVRNLDDKVIVTLKERAAAEDIIRDIRDEELPWSSMLR